MSDEYYDDDADEEGDPQWRTLTPKGKKVLLKNVFSNPDWYDEGEGTPVFQGGSANPLFQEIASKAGAPVGEIEDTMQLGLMDKDSVPQNTASLRQTHRSLLMMDHLL